MGVITDAAVSEEDDDRENEGLEEASELAALVDRIDARRNHKELSGIEPNDLSDASEKLHAEDTLRFIRKMETVEIQSYLDHCCQEYFESHPVCNGTENIQVRTARWKREYTYTHIREFFVKKSIEGDTLPHRFGSGIFLPLIPTASLQSPEISQQNTAFMRTFIQCGLPVFDAKWRQERYIVNSVGQFQRNAGFVTVGNGLFCLNILQL